MPQHHVQTHEERYSTNTLTLCPSSRRSKTKAYLIASSCADHRLTMRSLIFSSTFLSLWVVASATSSDGALGQSEATRASLVLDTESSVLLNLYDLRRLQDTSSVFRATWGTEHTGTCADADVPAARMTCSNDGEITLLQESDEANCQVTGTSEILCQGTLGQMFYTVDFSCAGTVDSPATAVATILEEIASCLGGVPETGSWVHGIQLFLICNDAPTPNGMCDPTNAVGENNGCSLGYSCTDGNCAVANLTIPDISSFIVDTACGDTTGTTDAPSAVDPAPTLAPTPTTAIVDPELLPTMEPTFAGTVDSFEPTFADTSSGTGSGAPTAADSNGADFISGSMRSNKVTAVSMLSMLLAAAFAGSYF